MASSAAAGPTLCLPIRLKAPVLTVDLGERLGPTLSGPDCSGGSTEEPECGLVTFSEVWLNLFPFRME